MTVGLFSLFGHILGWEINLMFITGILAIVGVSLDNTIVVFDRMRENQKMGVSADFEVVVNRSQIETLGRSLNTSITILITCVALLLFVGGTIQNFVIVLLMASSPAPSIPSSSRPGCWWSGTRTSGAGSFGRKPVPGESLKAGKSMFSGKSGATRLSIVVVIGLIVLKVAVGAITGSLSILAQAVDSFLDLFAVSITFLAIRFASKPADAEHPFGHGKAENIAAIVQAVLIFHRRRLHHLFGGTPRPRLSTPWR